MHTDTDHLTPTGWALAIGAALTAALITAGLGHTIPDAIGATLDAYTNLMDTAANLGGGN